MPSKIHRAGLSVVAPYNRLQAQKLSTTSLTSFRKNGGLIFNKSTFFANSAGTLPITVDGTAIQNMTTGGRTLRVAPGNSAPIARFNGSYWYYDVADPNTQALQFKNAGTYNLYFALPGVGVLRSANVRGPFNIDVSFYTLIIVPTDIMDNNEIDLVNYLNRSMVGLPAMTYQPVLFLGTNWRDIGTWDDNATWDE